MIHGIGGLEIYVQTLCKLLAEKGHEVHIICTPIRGMSDRRVNGVWMHPTRQPTILDHIYVLQNLSLLMFEVLAFIKFLRLNKRYNFHLVHIHGSGLFSFAISKKLGLHSKKFVYTEHGGTITAYEGLRKIKSSFIRRLLITFFYRFYAIPLTLFSLKYADAVIVTSMRTKNSTIHFFSVPRKKLFFIIDAASESVGHPCFSRVPIFLCIGRLVKLKNVEAIIKAFRYVNNIYPKAKLYIVGDGSERRNLETLTASLNLKNNIFFTGFIPANDLQHLYNSALAVLIPSLHEGVSNVLPEALSCGTPVIATRESGAEDVITDGKEGFVVDGENPQEFANKILWMLSNHGMVKKMIKQAYVRSHDFSWTKNVEYHIELYRKLLQ